MTPERLAELKALADAATPGPWEATNGSRAAIERVEGRVLVRHVHHDTMVILRPDGTRRAFAFEDLPFIAAARTAVPELLAEVERLRILLADVHAMARGCRCTGSMGMCGCGERIADELDCQP
jgi:hypothetical protein